MYRCKKCGVAVIVHNGKIHKGCTCVAPIILDLQAEAKGKGGLSQR